MASGFERALNWRCRLGKSPIWLPEEQVLLFVDIKAWRIHCYRPDNGAHDFVTVDEDIGCIAPAEGAV